jgi:hypothetical protein
MVHRSMNRHAERTAGSVDRTKRHRADLRGRRPRRERRHARWLPLFAWAIGALAVAWPAIGSASPAVDGTRNLSLGEASRGSSFGTQAALKNASNMPFSPQFAIEPMYQLGVQSRTHGLGFVIMDSLNNSRFSIGLGYLFMRGTPQVTFFDNELMADRNFRLSRFGHEVLGAVAVSVVKNWLSIGVTPKYQYASLRYRDTEGVARNAHSKLNAFGLDTSVTANFAGFVSLGVVGMNLVGNHSPAFTDERSINLVNLPVEEGSIDHRNLAELSDYPIGLAHGLSVFPLRNPKLSLNFDGTYDWSTYRFENHTRMTYGGSIEFILGPVPLRFGSYWDGRGRGADDDRIYVAGGIAYSRSAKVGGVGLDAGFGFRQQVTGPLKETILGFNIGILLNPDL